MAARLFLPWSNPILDNGGRPISGAIVNVFQNDTSVPVSTYQDIDLTTLHEVGIAASGVGKLPAIYVPEHLFYRAKLSTSDGTQLDEQDNCPGLGEDWTGISRDFLTNGRWRVYGAAGHPIMEFGDADGDDVGGTGTIQGWDGTPADLLTLNATQVNVTGDVLTENGKYVGLVRLAAGSPSNVATVDIALPAGYQRFRLELVALAPATDLQWLGAQFSYDSGATYKSGAGENSYQCTVQEGSSVTAVAGVSTTIPLQSSAYPNKAGGVTIGSMGSFEINARQAARIDGRYCYYGDASGAVDVQFQGGGYTNIQTGLATNIRLLMSSGAVSLTYVLYGYKKLSIGVTA